MILRSLQDLGGVGGFPDKLKMKNASEFARDLRIELSDQSVSFDDFFNDTVACFEPFEIPECEPDFVSDSGSKYWYGEDEDGDYVVRLSDHWGKRIASCSWFFMDYEFVGYSLVYLYETNRLSCGRCYLSEFKLKTTQL